MALIKSRLEKLEKVARATAPMDKDLCRVLVNPSDAEVTEAHKNGLPLFIVETESNRRTKSTTLGV